MKDKIITNILPVFVLTIFTFLLAQMTHFGFISNGSYGHDAGIFAYIGYAMQNGSALYTEIWENKGPLLYLINMIGVSINYYHGIYFIELISFFISIIFAYKTALLITKNNKWLSVLASIFSMLMLTVTLEGGNLCEEYSLPFVCIALYFITKFHFNKNQLRIPEIITVGMCFAGVFWLRINLCAFFVAMIIVTLFALCKQKQWQTLLKVISFTILGIIIFSIPILYYLISNNILDECFKEAYLTTLNGFTPLALITIVQNVYSMIKTTATTGYLYIAIIFLIAYPVCYYKKLLDKPHLKYMLSICFWGFVINLFANSLSGADHKHYFMSFVPIMIIPAAWIFQAIYQYFEKSIKKESVSLLAVFAIVFYISFVGFIQMGSEILRYSDYTQKGNNVIANYILENTEPADLVQVIGGDVTLNYHTKRLAGARHVHFAAGRFTDEMISKIANEIAQDIEISIPKLIVFESQASYTKFKQGVDVMDIGSFLNKYYTQHLISNSYIIYKAI